MRIHVRLCIEISDTGTHISLLTDSYMVQWAQAGRCELGWVECGIRYLLPPVHTYVQILTHTHLCAPAQVRSRGRLGVSFIHLFLYIYWSYRMVVLMLCYTFMAPSTCKDDISASAMCHHRGLAN